MSKTFVQQLMSVDWDALRADRSGIGPGPHLRRMKLDARVDNAEVGANLQEHLYLPMILQINETCATPEKKAPEFISFLNPDPKGTKPVFELLAHPDCIDNFFSWRLNLILLRSRSPGRLVPLSRNPFQHPHVEWNPFYQIDTGKDGDIDLFVQMVRRMWNVLLSARFMFENREFGVSPNPDEFKDKWAALSYLSKHIGLWQHPSGTCAIGKCVDNHLKVIGTRNVRVADASALPDSSSGHPEALLRVLGR